MAHSASTPPDPTAPRFLSEADCHTLLDRLTRVTTGGGHTTIGIHSVWTGNIRWGRNQLNTSGEVRTNYIEVYRSLNGATGAQVLTNDLSTPGLIATAREAERLSQLDMERPQSDLVTRYPVEQPTAPKLFSETTYQLDAAKRETAAVDLATSAAAAGMLSAGYIEVSAHSLALLDTYGRTWYFPYTQAQYSVTVRDPKGTGSGWAGVDYYDWAKIDGPKLSQIALDKCLKSRDAVKIEPGRYTVVLEPQAVCDFVNPMIDSGVFNRPTSEIKTNGLPFFKDEVAGPPAYGVTKLGERVIDERLSIGADPTDPDLGFPPFDLMYDQAGWQYNKFAHPVYHPVMWIERGVLTHLAYERSYGLQWLGQDTGVPNPGAFRMSVTGATNSIEDMIAGTKRGLLVTRFDQVTLMALGSTLCRGQTRDGLWLIENGKISKPVKNLIFTESVLFALNNVEAVGVPQRVFHPSVASVYPSNPKPVVVPALQIKDFSFTALDDAV